NGIIRGCTNSAVGTGASAHNNLVDVVPLRDVIVSAGGSAIGMPFEKITYKDATNQPVNGMPPRDDYANPNQDKPNATNKQQGLALTNHYTCAWGPNDTNRPKMIRIVVRVDDPNGKLADGQTYEYVINL